MAYSTRPIVVAPLEILVQAVTYATYGPPEVLTLREVATPTPGAREVLIAVRAAEATKSDCEMRSFRYSVKWFWLPLRLALGVRRPRRPILGGYFAGEVAAVGSGVTELAVGDAVMGSSQLRLGAYGEYLALPAGYTIGPKPRNMSFEEAAAVPLGGLNALHFLRRARVQPGESVLVIGAGGSIGAHGVQIAKAMGAEVTAVDAPVKEALVRRLGADHWVDYTREDVAQRGRRYDVVFDMVPHASYAGRLALLRPGGRYLTGNPRLSVMLRSPWTTRFTDKSASFAFARETREELAELCRMIEAGQIRPIVEHVLPMQRAAEAHRLVETEARRGAVVLSFGADA